jgi:hypothetical protein
MAEEPCLMYRDKNRHGKFEFRNNSINYTIVSSFYSVFNVQRTKIFAFFFVFIFFELLFVLTEND